MSAQLQIRNQQQTNPEIIERVIAMGDLSKLTPQERANYYRVVCESVGLNWATRPFEYISLQGKLTLYCRKDATDQLRKLNGVSITIISRERIDDVYVVTARATSKDGRHDESVGAVTISNAKGDALANLLMKAETKAKRRVTLSICGLGWLDESEIETIPNAQPVPHIQAVPSPTVDIDAQREDTDFEEAHIELDRAILREAELIGWNDAKLRAVINKRYQVEDGLDALSINTKEEVLAGLVKKREETEQPVF